MGAALAKVSRFVFALGALFTVALIVGLISWLAGEEEFPVPFSGETGDFGEYAWQVGAMVAVCLLVSRVLLGLAVRLADDGAPE